MLTRHKKLFLQRPMKHKLPRKPKNVAALKKLGVALLITIVAVFCYVKIQPHTLEAKQQIQLEHKSQQLKSTLHDLQTQKVNDAAQQKKLDDLQKQLQDTQKQLEAKRNSATAYAAELPQTTPTPAVVAPAAASGCVTGYSTGDYYLDKIISYESSGNSCATNYLGCFGLLQACPGSPLREACGGSPSCQIAWFQANKTGGRSWAQVWQHELTYGWW